MTTPDQTSSPARVRRKPPARSGPDRSGKTARAATVAAEPAPPSPPVQAPLDIDEAVAGSVQTAYDVLAESIEQGRRSAEQFRQGEYNIRDVPGDVRSLAANVLRLTRQLSETAFEVCEALLAQQPAAGAMPEPGTTPVPPFRDPADPPGAMPSAPAPPSTTVSPASVSAGMMQLTVQFTGVEGAIAHTTALDRPVRPVFADKITIAAMTARGTQPPLTEVAFATMTDGGLVATVTVPAGQPAGVYSGAVFAPGQELPLGLLVVELPQPAAAPNG